MKKIFMTLAAAVLAISASAQVYLGGAAGLTSVSHDGNSTTNFVIMPEIGYNLDDNWALGISVGYGESGKDATKVKTFIVNPYARYTFAKFSKVNLFVDGGFSFENVDSKSLGYKVNTWGIGLKPGVAVNLNEKFSLVAHLGYLGYESAKPDFDGAKATNTFGLSVDATTVNFGFYYNF